MKNEALTHASLRSLLLACAAYALLLLSACNGSDGSDGAPGAPAPTQNTNTVLTPQENAPGVVVSIVSIDGASGADGSFQVGDTISVNFRLQKNNGDDWNISEMSAGRMLVSGPSFNYQRVLPEVNSIVANAVTNADGSFTYRFATPIPATYAAPLNDTASFGPEDGELTGQALLAGTYTLGAYFGWSYTVDGESFRDVGNITADFLFQGAATIDKREVVAQDNCNRCHADLQAHGGLRRNVNLCLLCHTAGAEDRNVPAVANGTPGVSIDFRVMIHRIHNGEHLPSVLGIATLPDGSRDYAAVPQPFQIVGNSNSIHDFSSVAFPAWPNGLIAMPRDEGYTAASAPVKALEDATRTGVAECAICHGDPDGAGPIAAPAQGDVYKAQPSRQACASCHDDVNWGSPYTANGQTMPSQANNSNCVLCHITSGGPLAVEDAHRHPLKDPTFNPGLNLDISSLVESGTNNANGALDPGEKVAITFTAKNDAGVDIAPTSVTSMSVAISGPTSNYNLVHSATIPVASLVGAQPLTVNVPQQVVFEFVGDSTGALESFATSLVPHWTPTLTLTTIRVRTATAGGSSSLSANTGPPDNFIDVVDSTGFAHNDYAVIDDGVGGLEEYLRIQQVDGNRLWFSAPTSTAYAVGPRVAHTAGATVMEVTLTNKVEAVDYTVVPATGVITEVTEFGAGAAVVVSYTTDFVMPATYPVPINGGPGMDESWGKWTGLSIVEGTYSLGIWGAKDIPLVLFGETNAYRSTSIGHNVDFLVGSATTLEPYDLISSEANCQACHQDLSFHGGGRRGYETCILCHGTAGSEDRPQFVAANAPATTETTINFRTMLHKIHMGEDLANASTYTIVGFGGGAWPNNFGTSQFDEVVFPALPGGVQNCAMCHGTSTAWQEPAPRDHPLGQTLSTRAWRATCGACHDSAPAQAHIDLQTTAQGQESCAVCHGAGGEWNVALMHKTR
ncbi:MAG TPA: cytochrome c3 family protein [Planctomycetota bacterium]|nr:cytochrome c3 family protein [Planctomycetota bacterium]